MGHEKKIHAAGKDGDLIRRGGSRESGGGRREENRHGHVESALCVHMKSSKN